MDVVIDLMHRGGPFMWPLLLLSMLGPVAVFAGLGLSLARLRVPLVVWLGVPLMAAVVGELGAVQGLIMAEQAVAHASAEVASTLAAAGLSVAVVTSYSGWFLAAGLSGLAAGCLGLVGLVAHGEVVRTTPPHLLLLAATVALAVVIASVVSGPWVGLGVAVLVGGAVPAALKADALDDPDASAGRLAGVRLQAVFSGVFALVALARGRHLLGVSERFDALAFASAESKQTLMANASFMEPWGALAGAAVLALGGGLAVLLVARQLPLLRTAAGGVVFLLGGLLLGGAVVAADLTHDRLNGLTVPWEETQASVLQERGIAPPQVASARYLVPQTTVHLSPDTVWVDDVQTGTRRVAELLDGMHPAVFRALDQIAVDQAGGYGYRGRLLLLAPATLSLGELEPVLRAVAGARFGSVDIGVQTDSGLRAVRVDLGLPVHATAGSSPPSDKLGPELEEDQFLEIQLAHADGPHEEEPFVLELQTSRGGTQLLGVQAVFDGPPPVAPKLPALLAQLEEVKAQYPEHEEAVLRVHRGLNLQELAQLLLVLEGDEEDEAWFPYVSLSYAEDR